MKSALLALVSLLAMNTALAFEQVYLDRLIETRQCNFCNLSEADLSGQDSVASISVKLI